jgi:hypothetical protein
LLVFFSARGREAQLVTSKQCEAASKNFLNLCVSAFVLATKRKARGYRSTGYQITMLHLVAGKLEIPYY